MTTSLNILTKYLNNRSLQYYVNHQEEEINLYYRGENLKQVLIIIRLLENGEYLQMVIPRIANVQDHVFKGVLFRTLLHLQHQFKLLRLEYDPNSGDVHSSVEIPIEDGELTEEQFNRMFDVLVCITDEQVMPRLKAVLATGDDPGKTDFQRQLLAMIPPEILLLIEENMKNEDRF